MLLKGICTITKYHQNSDGSLIKIDEVTQENKICKRVYELLNTHQRVFTPSLRIAISQQNAAESYERITLDQIVAIGNRDIITNPYTYIEADGSEPAHLIYRNRFLAPSTARSFSSIAIVVSNDSIVNTTGVTRDNYTYLLLPSSYTQAITEVIDVNYKVFIDWTAGNYNIPDNFQQALEKAFFDLNLDYNLESAGIVSGPPTLATKKPGSLQTFDFVENLSSIYNNRRFWHDLPYLRTYAFRYGFSLQPSLGGYASGYWYGDLNFNNQPYQDATYGYNTFAEYVPFIKNSSLGNVYSHSVDATLPLYDANKLANSSWKPIITEATDTPTWPAVYLLYVMTSGGIGVGEYKLFKSAFAGWNGNQWGNQIAKYNIVEGNSQSLVYKEEGKFPYNPNHVIVYSELPGELKLATFKRLGGVGTFTLTPDSLTLDKKYDLETFTQLGTEIFDIAITSDGTKLYVASVNGLHEITLATDTITTLNTDRCIGVDIGFNNEVVAVFTDGATNGRVSASFGTDWSTALDFTGVTITWHKIVRIKIDPESSDFNLVIVEGPVAKNRSFTATNFSTSSNFIKYHWWNNVSDWVGTKSFNAVTDGAHNFLYNDLFTFPYQNSIQVKNGLWMMPGTVASTRDLGNSRSGIFQYPYMGGITYSTGYSFEIEDILQQEFYWNTFQLQPQAPYIYYKGNTNNLNITDYGLSSQVFIAFFTFNNYIGEFETEGNVGAFIKPKLSGEGSTYDVIISVESPPSSHDTYIPINPWSNNIFKLSIDEITPTITVDTNYTVDLGSSKYGAHIRDSQYTLIGSQYITEDKVLINFEPISRRMAGDIKVFSTLRDPVYDVTDQAIMAYKWSGTDWELDPENTGPGKLLHTADEDLIDGLSIAWQDLQPGNSQDLVINQYYTFTKTYGEGRIPIETTTSNIDVRFDVFIRPLNEVTETGTIPGGDPVPLTVDAAPTGGSPDPLWLSLHPDNPTSFNVLINGIEADVFYNPSTTPAGGTVHITNATTGEIHFSAADNGQPYSITYTYLQKVDSTEVL